MWLWDENIGKLTEFEKSGKLDTWIFMFDTGIKEPYNGIWWWQAKRQYLVVGWQPVWQSRLAFRATHWSGKQQCVYEGGYLAMLEAIHGGSQCFCAI